MVIPGRPERAGPGIHEHRPLEYGFRAHRCAAPRNDEYCGSRPMSRTLCAAAIGIATLVGGCLPKVIEPLPAVSGQTSRYCGRYVSRVLDQRQLEALSSWLHDHRSGWLSVNLIAPPPTDGFELMHPDGRTTSLHVYYKASLLGVLGRQHWSDPSEARRGRRVQRVPTFFKSGTEAALGFRALLGGNRALPLPRAGRG
jgi:hypothetical protein